MKNLTLEKIETQTTSSNLERGKIYFKSGMVTNFKITNKKFIQADVTGNKNYKVFLEVIGDGYDAYCTCPYKSKGYCKHQVAVKMALMKIPEQAEIISISEKDERLLKYYTQILYLFYKVKYKLF